MEVYECDFCGEEFNYLPNSEMAQHDFCVCDDCVDTAREQLTEMGDIDEDEEDYGSDSGWWDIDMGPGLNY